MIGEPEGNSARPVPLHLRSSILKAFDGSKYQDIDEFVEESRKRVQGYVSVFQHTRAPPHSYSGWDLPWLQI